MCINQNAYTNYVNSNFTIFLGDLTPTKAKRQGHVIMQLQGSISTTLTNVLYVLSFSTNLLFVPAFFSKRNKVYFEESSCSIYCPDETHLRTGI